MCGGIFVAMTRKDSSEGSCAIKSSMLAQKIRNPYGKLSDCKLIQVHGRNFTHS